MQTILLLVILGLSLYITYGIRKIIARQKQEDEAFKMATTIDEGDYKKAKEFVISTKKASTSSLQTAFRWGYNKTARIIQELEDQGVIGPSRAGERYREILKADNE
jgi:S-DNA-T family DNA segregation ATPase FtsK/SpoIIIE